MGCGKSKHDVATGNTIARKKSKDSEIIRPEPDNKENSSEKQENSGTDDHDNVKDITEHREVKEDGGVETGRLISKDSPHRFFSSRKDDDVDGEGRSETFYSPRVESGKETLFNAENGKMNDDKLVQEAKQETEDIADETAILKEDLVEEAEISSSDKPDVASPAMEKKLSGEETVTVPATQENQTVIVPATKDEKTI